MAVGIFDSGLGGLTVYRAVAQALPDVPLVYYGDNAQIRYGVREPDDIYDLTCKGTQRLFDAGCDLVILACGTASAAALRKMQDSWVPRGKRVLGVFVPLIEALSERSWGDNSPPRKVAVKNVALFASSAAVACQSFQRELAFRAIGVDVVAQSSGGIARAIERGDNVLADALVRSHVEDLLQKMPKLDVAVLGSAHFAKVERAFQEALGGDVTIYSPPKYVAESLVAYLARHPQMVGQGSAGAMLTTGDPDLVSAQATSFLGRALEFVAA